jgi:hypothetical protein
MINQSRLRLNWIKLNIYNAAHLRIIFYWLANGNPSRYQKWNFMNASQLDEEYTSQLTVVYKMDTLIALVSSS